MAEPLPTSKKVFDLQGEGQINADGGSRQEELRRCVPGEPVELRREPDNQADPNMIIVLSARGVPIGRLTRQYAALLAPLVDQRRPHKAKLHCLRGGVEGYPNYGARISIAWDGRPGLRHRPLDEAQLRYRRTEVPGRGRRIVFTAGGAVHRSVGGGAVSRAVARDELVMTLILAALALSALAAYALANIISSYCWACG